MENRAAHSHREFLGVTPPPGLNDTFEDTEKERLSENVHATIPIVIVGGFEFTVFQFERMARETMDVRLRVLKEHCQEQRINHIPYYLSDLLRSHFFRQPFSK